MTSGGLLLLSKSLGIAMLVAGILAANITVFRMQQSLNITVEENISPWKVMGKASSKYSPVSRYLDHFGSTTLYRAYVIANWFALIGAALGLGSIWVGKAA